MGGVKRVCLLTGASGALGAAFIDRYAGRYQIVGVHHTRSIYFASQDQTFLDPLAPTIEIEANRQRVYSISADLATADEITRVIEEVIDQFGRVDLLVNAAAAREWSHLLDRRAIESAETVLKVNVLAALRLSVGIAQSFWCQDPDDNLRFNRNIVNVSSAAGLFVYPDLDQALYATSKAALNHLSYHLASEFWDIGIRVNTVAPDTFPGRTRLEDILEAILDFDQSRETGQLSALLPL